jgi:hypothetical protein
MLASSLLSPNSCTENSLVTEAQDLACVVSSVIYLFLNMHTVVLYNVDCLYMKTCEPQLLNLSS